MRLAGRRTRNKEQMNNVFKNAGENERETRFEKFQIVWKMVKKVGQWCVEQFYPRCCPICDGILEPEQAQKKIHPACRKKLYPVMGAVCMQCGRPLDNSGYEYCHDCVRDQTGDYGTSLPASHPSCSCATSNYGTHTSWQGKALYLYQGPIKQTMYRFKYSNRREYADFFAGYALEQYGDWIREKQIDVIVPVPMYRKKQRVRGYNQAECFAKALSKLTGIPVDNSLVRRVVDTTPQKELNDLERKNNLKNAFQKCKSIVQYKHILVVDDIYTTGSTARAVIEELRELETGRIYVLCVCIGKGL